MSDNSFRTADWYKKFLEHPEFAKRPNKHPEVAKFIRDPKNLALYLKDADLSYADYLKHLPSVVFEPSFRESLIEFLSRKGDELQFLPNDLKKDADILRAALGSEPRAIYYLEENFRDDEEFVLPYLIKSPIIAGLLSRRLQNDIEFISKAVKANTYDVLGILAEDLRNNPALIQAARTAIFKFGSEDAWDNVDWARLQICDDSSWTFSAAQGTRQYEGMGFSQIDLDEFSVSGTWKKLNDSVLRLTPSVPLSKFRRWGESQSTELFPKGTEEVDPVDLSFTGIKNGRFVMKRYFGSGDEAVFELLYGLPKFLM